jgi:hypothetical protein
MSVLVTLNGSTKRRRTYLEGVCVAHDMVYCGREGFLTIEELVRRTEQGIRRYAKRKPLRFRLGQRLLPPLRPYCWMRKRKQPTKGDNAKGIPSHVRRQRRQDGQG